MARSNDTDGCGTTFILLVVVYAIVQFIKKNYITICIVLGIIALIILFAMTYSRKKKAESALSSKSEQISTPPQNYQPSEAQLKYVNDLLKRAHNLTNILNTTLDKEEFYISFDELNSVLKYLSQFEDRISFSEALPSVSLQKINNQKQALIDSLEHRIKENEIQNQGNSDINSPELQEKIEVQEEVESDIDSPELQEEIEVQEEVESDIDSPELQAPLDAQLVKNLLEEAYHLADIINTTIDREKFYISFDRLSNILKCLSQFEDRISFSGALPSDDLKKINAQKQAIIDSLERRIKEAEIQKQIGSPAVPEPIQKRRMEVDYYFEESGFFTIDKEKASIGMLQRKFGIGFNRAATIMDQLCDAGVVGPVEGVKPRKVLMSAEQFKEFIDSAELIESVSTNIVPSTSENDSPIDKRVQMYNGKYDYMEGHDFEYFCADLLRRNGFYNVNVTQGSNDQGIDIAAKKDGVLYGIQCKRYSSDVGNKAVQEVFSGKTFYGCHVGVVLTNQHFTKSAIDLAKAIGVLLWDREKLEELIKNAQ